jgi:hypothetical protein
MIFLRAPEFWGRFDLRHDWAFEFAALIELCFRRLGRRFLLGRMIKNDRAILRANIRALAIDRRWVVIRPENVEQLIIAHLRRVEFHLHDFRVSRFIRANVLVSRVLLRSTGVTDRRVRNTFELPKGRLHSPKTASTECRFFCHGESIRRKRFPRKKTIILERRSVRIAVFSWTKLRPRNYSGPLRRGLST